MLLISQQQNSIKHLLSIAIVNTNPQLPVFYKIKNVIVFYTTEALPS